MKREVIFLFTGLFLITLLFIGVIFPASVAVQNADVSLLSFFNSNRLPIADTILKIITNTSFAISISVPLFLFGYALVKKSPVIRRKSILIFISWLITVLSIELIKRLINRPRPFKLHEHIQKLSSGGSPSFPSGHTAEAFVIAFSLLLLFSTRRVILLSFALWAILVAYSRMYLGVHYPSDVLAGIGYSLVIASTVKYIGMRTKKKAETEKLT